jgi:hypothetical protein
MSKMAAVLMAVATVAFITLAACVGGTNTDPYADVPEPQVEEAGVRVIEVEGHAYLIYLDTLQHAAHCPCYGEWATP